MRIIAGHQHGYMALRHDGFVADGYTVDLRACLYGVRISGRIPPLQKWKIKKGDHGDINGALHWPTAGRDKRPIGSFFLTGVLGVVHAVPEKKKESGNTPTKEGTNTRPSQDPEHQQADNPFIAGVKGRSGGGKSTTGPDTAQVGVVTGTKKEKDSQNNQPPPTTALPADQVLVLPIRNRKWEKDTRYLALAAAGPKDKKGKALKLAAGQHVLVVAGSEEDSQEAICIPVGNTSLVAVNKAGPPDLGSTVYDLDGEGAIDPDRGGRFQGLMRVVKKPKGALKYKDWFPTEENVLALNLGPFTGKQDSLAGVFYYGAALLSTESFGGPFSFGDAPADQHTYGEHADGVMRPLHFSSGALWKSNNAINVKAKGQGFGTLTGRTTKGGSDQQSDRDRQNNQDNWLDDPNLAAGDGPMLFESKFHPCLRAPYSVYVHLEWDEDATHSLLDQKMKGCWRWRAESFLYEVPAPTPPPTDGPPTDGPPDEGTPGQPGQPERPGELPPDQPWGFLIPGSLRVTPEGDLTGDVIGAGDAHQPGGSGVKIGLEPGVTDTGTVPQDPAPPPGPDGGVSPGELRRRGWWGSIRPPVELGTGEFVYERPWDQPRRFTATSVELGVPAMVFRAQLFRRGAPYLTNDMHPSPAALAWLDTYAPVVARFESHGAQGGTPGDDILDGSPSGTLAGDPFAYTTQRASGSPYPNTSDGAVVLLPGEVGLIDIDTDFEPVPGMPRSTAYLTLPHVAVLGLGRPDLTSGGITRGWSIGVDATGQVDFTHVDADGVATPVASLNADGTISGFGSGGAPSMAAIFGQTADQTIGGTGTETSLFGTGAGAASIPSNGWAVGMSARTLLRGRISTIFPTPGTVAIKGKLAGATNISMGAGGITAQLNQALFEVEFIATCRDLSTPSAAVFVGSLIFRTIGTTVATPYVIASVGWSGTVDTTAATSIDVTFQWGTSSGGNTLTTTVGKVDTETPG